MLIQRIQSLKQEVVHLKQLGSSAHLLEQFQTRCRQLEEPLKQLRVLVGIVERFRTHGLALPAEAETTREILAQLEGVAQRYSENPATIVGPDKELKLRLWDPLATLPQRLRMVLMARWTEHVRGQLRSNDQLLAVLDHIPEFRPQIQMIRHVMSRATDLSNELPADDSAFAILDDLASRLRSAWSRLPTGGEDGALSAFLQKTGSTQGVAVSDLTDEILAWIRENDLGQAFRVTISRI